VERSYFNVQPFPEIIGNHSSDVAFETILRLGEFYFSMPFFLDDLLYACDNVR